MPAHYSPNSNERMNSDTMETVLGRLDCIMSFENRKVFLLLNKATCHLESLQNGLTNIKLMFLSKNATFTATSTPTSEYYFFILSLVASATVKLHSK